MKVTKVKLNYHTPIVFNHTPLKNLKARFFSVNNLKISPNLWRKNTVTTSQRDLNRNRHVLSLSRTGSVGLTHYSAFSFYEKSLNLLHRSNLNYSWFNVYQLRALLAGWNLFKSVFSLFIHSYKPLDLSTWALTKPLVPYTSLHSWRTRHVKYL